MTTFFTSDTHFFHENIMKFCPKTRPYSSVAEMNENLIDSWNSVVGPRDTVWHCGDFAMGRFNGHDVSQIFSRLNGHKNLIYGNHDPKEVRSLPWQWQGAYKILREMEKKIVLFHFPIIGGQWDGAHHGSYHLFGHVHGSPMPTYEGQRALDVGIDSIGPVPLSLEQIIERMEKIPVKKIHHA